MPRIAMILDVPDLSDDATADAPASRLVRELQDALAAAQATTYLAVGAGLFRINVLGFDTHAAGDGLVLSTPALDSAHETWQALLDLAHDLDDSDWEELLTAIDDGSAADISLDGPPPPALLNRLIDGIALVYFTEEQRAATAAERTRVLDSLRRRVHNL